jgi:hypothetical protein
MKSEGDILGEERFDKLVQMERWQNECTKLTVHRQRQLAEILNQYGGKKIPFSHFTAEICSRDMSLRNSQAYPAVCAYHCGILRKAEGGLAKPAGLVLGVSRLESSEKYW